MRQCDASEMSIRIAVSEQDRAKAGSLVSRIYGAPSMELRERKDAARHSTGGPSATRVVIICVGEEVVGTLAITADAFAPTGRKCRMELEQAYRLENTTWRQGSAEVNRVAIATEFRCPQVRTGLYEYAARYSLRYKLHSWIGGVDLQTDCRSDALLMARVLSARGHVANRGEMVLARYPRQAIAIGGCNTLALRHFYQPRDIARLPISQRVTGFSKAWGATVCGPIVPHPHYQRYVVAMLVCVPQMMAIQKNIRSALGLGSIDEVASWT